MIRLRLLMWELILDCPGGPKVIAGSESERIREENTMMKTEEGEDRGDRTFTHVLARTASLLCVYLLISLHHFFRRNIPWLSKEEEKFETLRLEGGYLPASSLSLPSAPGSHLDKDPSQDHDQKQ